MALKIGIVGMGAIGNTHARCYKKDSLAELVAVCDVIKEKADKAAERWGVNGLLQPEGDARRVPRSGYRRHHHQRV